MTPAGSNPPQQLSEALASLTISASLPEIRRAMNSGPAVLMAPPGSGKTTGVPLALLDEPWLAGKKILMLEPRRLAARAAASRMSRLLGEPIGRTVGYQIRFERCITAVHPHRGAHRGDTDPAHPARPGTCRGGAGHL